MDHTTGSAVWSVSTEVGGLAIEAGELTSLRVEQHQVGDAPLRGAGERLVGAHLDGDREEADRLPAASKNGSGAGAGRRRSTPAASPSTPWLVSGHVVYGTGLLGNG